MTLRYFMSIIVSLHYLVLKDIPLLAMCHPRTILVKTPRFLVFYHDHTAIHEAIKLKAAVNLYSGCGD